jgi:O-antigen/teichoic acid export membrane protein
MLAAPLWTVDILGILSSQSDQLIIQKQMGYSALAEYAAAFTFIGLMDQPMTILSRVFLVTFAGGFYNEYDHYRQVISLNLAFFSLLSFGVIAISGPLTPILFTSEYQMVPILVMILSITNIISSVEVVDSSLTIAVDYPHANRNAKFWTTLFYIPAAIFLVSRYGVYGAAWSNVGSWLGYALLHAFYMRRRLPQHAALAMRSFLISTTLYTSTILAIWYFKSSWLILLAVPIYLLLGQALKLWNLGQLPQLARRLMPERLALSYAAEAHDSQREDKDPEI